MAKWRWLGLGLCSPAAGQWTASPAKDLVLTLLHCCRLLARTAICQGALVVFPLETPGPQKSPCELFATR